MRSAAVVLGLFLPLSAWAADEGAVYRWVDQDGTPHYQDRPPEGEAGTALQAEEMRMRYRLSDPEAIAAANARRAEARDVAGLREDQATEDQAAADADRQKLLEERDQGCAKARERLQQYETAHKLYKPGPNGERKYLTDEETDAARLEARQDVQDWCGE